MTALLETTLELSAAEVGPENPLPCFRGTELDMKFRIDPKFAPPEPVRAGWRCAYRVLPYKLQDGYTRERKKRKVPVIRLENEFLSATFVPELGGRLWSLIHKLTGRELLAANPAFQPANLALRNAWFAGGVEWNCSHLGHAFHTCAPVFTARITGTKGEPALRMYEWDRLKAFPWMIDFHLPPGSKCLLAHVRLVNPHAQELPQYWWSNIAVPETPGTRVIVPADMTLAYAGRDSLAYKPLPNIDGKDVSYSTLQKSAREYYFQIQPGERPWITALDESGKGLVQVSTQRLKGRKMFCWGTGTGGNTWQQMLSPGGRPYIEIQAGLERMQAASIPMPPKTEWNWTEAYGMLEADPKMAHGEWSQAWKGTRDEIEKIISSDELNAQHTSLIECSHQTTREILTNGSGWGALERKRLQAAGQADSVPQEWNYPDLTLTVEQKPWLELLEQGKFPDFSALATTTGAFMLQSEWEALLERAANGSGNNAMVWYHLGVMRMERGDASGATDAWEKSVKLRPTAWALRNLAQIEVRGENLTKASDLMLEAWRAGPKNLALALECANLLVQTARFSQLSSFIKELNQDIRSNERVKIIMAQAALKEGRWKEVAPLFDQDFATIREGELTLTDIFFDYHAQRIASETGVKVDEALKKRVRSEFVPPVNIDYRLMADADLKNPDEVLAQA